MRIKRRNIIHLLKLNGKFFNNLQGVNFLARIEKFKKNIALLIFLKNVTYNNQYFRKKERYK